MAVEEPISPELVLVCPELRAALQAAFAREGLAPRPAARDASAAAGARARVDPLLPAARVEAGAVSPSSVAAIVPAAVVYAVSRLVSISLHAVLLIGALVGLFLVATQLRHI